MVKDIIEQSATGGMMGTFYQSLSSNPYFSAGFGLVGVGTAMALVRSGWRAGLHVMRRRLLLTMEISSKDASYNWVLPYLLQINKRNPKVSSSLSTNVATAENLGKNLNGEEPKPATDFMADTKLNHLSLLTRFVKHANGSTSVFWDFAPSIGSHLIKFNNRYILVNRQRDQTVVDMTTGQPFETVTLTTLALKGDSSMKLFESLLKESRELARVKEEGKTVIYTSWGTEWRPFGQPRRRRSISSVLLADGLGDSILQDFKKFMQSGQWYMNRGIPYRRGYLLYGPPGCGKSSYIQALAGEVGYDICILSLSDRGLTDDRLSYILSVAPPRCVILLEDVDAAFTSGREAVDAKNGGFSTHITFSGLLNVLDGVASSEERIIFMTTNHLEKLDPALIRPGRIDVKQYIGYATRHQMEGMFNRFFPDCSDTASATFVERVIYGGNKRNLGDLEAKEEDESKYLESLKISMAQLQAFFLLHQNSSPREAIDSIEEYLFSSDNMKDTKKDDPMATTASLLSKVLELKNPNDVVDYMKNNKPPKNI
ncbi:mitochondrial chaperone BCS1 [Acrasis kona]|uniref:Mitochondrial chaperone BCS1 n=1 Tax=Acrasis kona TaxID=1008807 RepID=A0AAW2YZG1_9EUKA